MNCEPLVKKRSTVKGLHYRRAPQLRWVSEQGGREESSRELYNSFMLAFSNSSFLQTAGQSLFPVPCPPSGGEFQRASEIQKTFAAASCRGQKLKAGVTCTTEWSRLMSREHSPSCITAVMERPMFIDRDRCGGVVRKRWAWAIRTWNEGFPL